MDTENQRMTARLPGSWIPADLLARAHAIAGPRGFSSWIRKAMERQLAIDERKAGRDEQVGPEESDVRLARPRGMTR